MTAPALLGGEQLDHGGLVGVDQRRGSLVLVGEPVVGRGAGRCGSTRSSGARPGPAPLRGPCPPRAAGSGRCGAADDRWPVRRPARCRAPAMISSSPSADSGWPRRGPFNTTNTRSVSVRPGVRRRGSRRRRRRTGWRSARTADGRPCRRRRTPADRRPRDRSSRRPRTSQRRSPPSSIANDHRPVPVRAQRADQRVDLGRRQDLRQRPRHPHQRHRPDVADPAGGVAKPRGTGFAVTGVSPRATRYA